MKMIDQLKHLVYIAPVRCGRTFFQCQLKDAGDEILMILTPTDFFKKSDVRTENESSFPGHIHRFEEWQHTGMAVGSIEYFLNERGIHYSISVEDDRILLNIDNVDVDTNIDKHETLRHSQRSFDLETPVDDDTVSIINNIIDQSELADYYKIMITDPKVRDVIYSLAIYWEGEGKPGNIHIPQMNAPLLITIPPKQFDLKYFFHMGRVYSKIGLTVLDRGYQLAFCNSFNYFNDRVKMIEDTLHLTYGEYTLDTLIPRPFICIGTALDKNKPHNWVAEHNRVVPTDVHLNDSFIEIAID